MSSPVPSGGGPGANVPGVGGVGTPNLAAIMAQMAGQAPNYGGLPGSLAALIASYLGGGGSSPQGAAGMAQPMPNPMAAFPSMQQQTQATNQLGAGPLASLALPATATPTTLQPAQPPNLQQAVIGNGPPY